MLNSWGIRIVLKGMFDYSLYWSSLMISIEDNSTRIGIIESTLNTTIYLG